jgi:hypothetical protein
VIPVSVGKTSGSQGATFIINLDSNVVSTFSHVWGLMAEKK